MKVLIIGRHETLYATAAHIAENTDHQIVAVVTGTSRPEYRKDEGDFETLATRCDALFYHTDSIDDRVYDICTEAGAEVGISVNWISIIPPRFLRHLKHGVLNAHFGDLPRYRGNAATNWGLLSRESELVLTVHRMADDLDAGDILLKRRMTLDDQTTIADVNHFSEQHLPEMFANALDGLESGSLKPERQSETGLNAFRCYPRLPRDGKIDWRASASDIHALIRSLTKPYSGAYTFYRDAEGVLKKLYIWKSEVVEDDTSDLGVPGHVIRNVRGTGASWVYTGQGVLALNEVSHGEHGRPFAPGQTWRSIRMRLGMDLEEELFRLLG